MRILYVTIADIDRAGGHLEHIFGIAGGLAELGDEVHLVAPRTSYNKNLTFGSNLVLHEVNITASTNILKMINLTAQKVFQLSTQIAPDIAYVRAFPLDSLFLTRGLRRRGVPYVYELNTIIDKEYVAMGKPWRGYLFRLAEKYSLRASAGWLPVTREIGAYAEKLARTKRPWVLAENGFFPSGHELDPATRNSIRKSLGAEESSVVLIMAGFRHSWHGFDRAIGMLRHLNGSEQVQLWLAGALSEADRENAKKIAAKYGVADRVRVLGWMRPDALWMYVAAADIGLGPLAMERKSLREAQPIKIGTYLSFGLPVLINYVDSRLEPELPFVSYVPSENIEFLASGLRKLLPLTPALREGAKNFAHENLSWSAIARRTDAFLRSLLE